MKQEAAKGTCVDCGGIFFYIRGGRIPMRCPKCQRAKNKADQRKWYAKHKELRKEAGKEKYKFTPPKESKPTAKRKKKEKRETLDEACRKAREMGISYGKYKALQYIAELKRQKEKPSE